jgi:hypothetical protein
MNTETSPAKFEMASPEIWAESGWDSDWIIKEPDQEGPYSAIVNHHGICPCCGSECSGWAVIDLRTATAVGGQEWYDGDPQADAEEHAAILNAAWLSGYREATSTRTDPT